MTEIVDIFNLVIVYLINTLLFVLIKQTRKNRNREVAIHFLVKL